MKVKERKEEEQDQEKTKNVGGIQVKLFSYRLKGNNPPWHVIRNFFWFLKATVPLLILTP
jgi:hypothetical protein